MMKKIAAYFKSAFPFLSVLVLWHLSVPFWNPGGLLALIPIFYYSFIKPTDWFVPFSILFCFLIDYKFDTVLFWTFMYCLFYAANGLQNFVDLARQKNDGILVLVGYVSIASLILIIFNWSFTGFIRAIWFILWITALYIPFVAIAKRVDND
ncbi:MAG TPA: hypothetical protein PKJ33_01245 [Alphaproteobacteria bacterium]|nr:hypothetical protein [Alphaproteobacteria bacterium]